MKYYSPQPVQSYSLLVLDPTFQLFIDWYIYVPPNSSDSSDKYKKEFLNYIDTFKDLNDNLVLMGDFNLGDIKWDTLCGQS